MQIRQNKSSKRTNKASSKYLLKLIKLKYWVGPLLQEQIKPSKGKDSKNGDNHAIKEVNIEKINKKYFAINSY